MRLAVLLACLMACPVLAGIDVPEKIQTPAAIVAKANVDIPDEAKHKGEWEISGPGEANFIRVDDKTVHIWADPGLYTISYRGMWVDFENREFDYLNETARFEVTSEKPDPLPPAKRWGVIVEETGRRTPEQAALWSDLVQAVTLHDVVLVDQDSEAESVREYVSVARDLVEADDANLPILVVVTPDDGSVVNVMECPQSVAEIKEALGLDE